MAAFNSNSKGVAAVLALVAVLVGVAWGAWVFVIEPNNGTAVIDLGAPEVDDPAATGEDDDSDSSTSGNEPATEPELTDEQKLEAQVQEIIDGMTVEEKCAQLFVTRPEDVTGVATQTMASEATRKALEQYPVGGICYFGKNLIDPEQTREMLANTKSYYEGITGLPLFCAVDEEGGTVARIGGNSSFGVEWVGNMADVASVDDARAKAVTIGEYLTPLGFNVDFAPDADIASVEGSSLALRSFGSTADEVTPKVKAQVEGFLSTGILCCAKHFPGIGGTVADSHDGTITSEKTLDEMRASELLTFEGAIESGVPFIMVGHLSCPNVTGDMIPASVNPVIVTDLLRDELGYEGIVITDSLAMGAVVDLYSAEDMGVAAIEAGVDMVLMPADFPTCYQGVVDAVKSGELAESRIDESLERIIRTKLTYLA